MGERALPNWLDSYMLFTERTEPPILYRKWCGLWAIGAALRRKCYFEWHETVYPNLYVLLVGPSGAKKGTAMAPVRTLVKSLTVPHSGDSGSVQALMQFIAKSAKRENEEVDENGVKIKHCDGNMLVFSDEFTVFTSANNPDLYPLLCRLYECPSVHEHKILGREGGDFLRNVWIHLLGATTPRSLRDALPQGQASEGFTARFIIVWGDRKEKWVADPKKTPQEMALFDQLQEDLLRIEKLDGEFTPAPGWYQMYEAWYLNMEKEKPHTEEEMLDGYFSRRAAHLLKIQMAVSASQDDSMKLTPKSFLTSLHLLEEVERLMPLVFSGHGRLPTAVVIPRVARRIRDATEEDGGIAYRVLVGEFMRDLTKDEMDQIIQAWLSLGRVEMFTENGVRLIRFKEKKG